MTYFVCAWLCMRMANRLGWRDVKDTLAAALCGLSWQDEVHSVHRLLRYGMRYAFMSSMLAILLILLYSIEASRVDFYECTMWSVDVTAIAEAMYPWNKMGTTVNSFVQWAFILLACALYAMALMFWGPYSLFVHDTHCEHARHIYCGLEHICQLLSYDKLQHKCVHWWRDNALGDITQRRRNSWVHYGWVTLYALLHLPPGLFMSLPALAFVL